MIVPPTSDAIRDAATRLRRGGLVAFATETVYGLGALTHDEHAIAAIYRAKRRPATNPLIAHVPRGRDAAWFESSLVARWTDEARRLAEAFWPGPLAFVVPRHASVPPAACGGRDTIALRCPDHPVALDLLDEVDAAISAPSANRSGRVSPTSARHVEQELGGMFASGAPDTTAARDARAAPSAARTDGGDERRGAEASPAGSVVTASGAPRDLLILDGGPCRVGIESTVLDLTGSTPPRILRPGAITASMIATTLELEEGTIEEPDVLAQAASPGTSDAHYRPDTPVQVIALAALPAALAMAATRGGRGGPSLEARTRGGGRGSGPTTILVHREDEELPPLPKWIHTIRMPADAIEYAQALYARIRTADDLAAQRIVITSPPGDPAWRAVHDRLRRMAGG